MEDIYILGVGLKRFGKYLDHSIKDLGKEVIDQAIMDASISKEQIDSAFFANAMGGIVTGQECVAGQIVFQHCGINEMPIFNIENACASGASAIHLAVNSIRSGVSKVALVAGVEKLYHEDRKITSQALASASDVELLPEKIPASFFMNTYAEQAGKYLNKYRCGVEAFAQVSVKNHYHASFNPYAQYQNEVTLTEVLESPTVVEPLTRLMCSPISDGAAAILIGTSEFLDPKKSVVRISASQIVSGNGTQNIVMRAAKKAYQEAKIKPQDVSLAEVHDATSPAEISIMEELLLCGDGEGHKLVMNGDTTIGGSIPINPSGGLSSKGHPIAVTGIAQIIELYFHLSEQAGARQVANARIGLAENAGGWVNSDAAAGAIHILERID